MSESVILLVDDSDDDAFMFRKALQRAQVSASLVHLSNGQAAIDYLSGSGEYSKRDLHPLPSILLLDSQLPRVSGFEILSWTRQQAQYKNLPVLMLTGSSRPLDEERARELGATGYFEKSPRCSEVIEKIRLLLS